ncbi:MAG: HmuY family protein [Myxococcota bacterium]|nr:HmuY family protein [Myxococcota bacterium]
MGCTRMKGASRFRSHLPAAAGFLFLWVLPLVPGGCGEERVVHGDVTVASETRGLWALYSFDLEDVVRDSEGEALLVSDPSEEGGWDLAISQWVIATASGSSVGPETDSRGALLAVEGTVGDWPSLEDFTAQCSDFTSASETNNDQPLSCSGDRTPTVDAGWIADSLDDPDGAGPFGTVSYHPSVTFWFEYEFTGHEVLPYGNIYVVETRAGDCVKLQVTDYYDESGSNGHVSFSWSFLSP